MYISISHLLPLRGCILKWHSLSCFPDFCCRTVPTIRYICTLVCVIFY